MEQQLTDRESVIKKEIIVNNTTIKVVKKNCSEKKMLEQGIITPDDAEMDQRARAAVNMEKKKAKVCKKPIAVYDKKSGEAYLIDSEGKKVSFG